MVVSWGLPWDIDEAGIAQLVAVVEWRSCENYHSSVGVFHLPDDSE